MLAYLGLKERLTHRPSELSGGEQQRVAIARAVANAPRVLLADEPTGNLDPHTAEHVFSTLMQLVRATGLAAIIATHNLDLAARMDRRVTIRDGKVVMEYDSFATSATMGFSYRSTNISAPDDETAISEPTHGHGRWDAD